MPTAPAHPSSARVAMPPLWVALLVLWAAALPPAARARHLLIRDMPEEPSTCSNTVQGAHFVADSAGYHCPREHLNHRTGCCAGGRQYSCEGCSEVDQCCSEYEACVSCCMDPKHGASAKASAVARSRRVRSGGSWDSPFAFCTNMCRSHGMSTVHENAYISARHHCFSELGRPFVSDPLPFGALDGVALAVSQVDQSCDDACRDAGRACSAPHLHHANSCDRLREHVGCEAGCGVQRDGSSGELPAYVSGSAPKANLPAMCHVAPPGTQLGCAAKHKLSQRLCTCV